ncbi:MAG: potassium/proton antiporter [Tannerella sp.]|jgi:cell volume regulation protein A|nr:potassium/proton antiporter [Tannerella sp.]
MDFSNITVENMVLVGSLLLLVSIIAGKTGYRFGVPTLVLFLIVGMVFGHSGLRLVEFSSPRAAQLIGVLALNIILFSGGMDTKFSEIKPVLPRGVILATAGVLLTAVITGVFIYLISQHFLTAITFSFLEALLLASVMSSTDSASVFAILGARGLVLKERLRPLLELESGSNDPMAYLLTITFIQWIQIGEGSLWSVAGTFILQLAVGAALGYLLGRLAVRVMNRINIDNESLYPVLLLTLLFIVFSITNVLHGNGYLAVYISGLVVGNSKFVHKKTSKKFMDGMTWLFQIVMFLTLGLLVNPAELLPIAGIGLAVSFFVIFVSRPVAVWLCLLPFRNMSGKAKHYVSWVGLRGAAPILFATYPLTSGIEGAGAIFNIVFFVTLVSLLVQGTTVPAVARWLGLAGEDKPQSKLQIFDVEISDDIKSSMSEVTLTPGHLSHGKRIMDMPMPENTLVVMVKRDEAYFVPTGSTALEPGDVLLLISDNDRTLEETYESLGIAE